MKKIASIFLCLIYMMQLSICGFSASFEDTCYECLAHIAFVNNVNSTGSNVSREDVIESVSEASVTVNDNGEISASLIINDEILTFCGTPQGKTESGKSIFFDGVSSNEKYEIVDYTYVSDTSVTSAVFSELKNNDETTQQDLLKIYFKDNQLETKNYYFIEIFDIDMSFNSEIVESLDIDPLLGAWISREFEATSTEVGMCDTNQTPRIAAYVQRGFCLKSFKWFGEIQTHTIYWKSNLDYTNVLKGQDANQHYRLTVESKSVTHSVNTDMDSDTESCLRIKGLELRLMSIPNTAWKAVKIDGKVRKLNIFKPKLSAEIGVAYGLLGASLSIDTDYTEFETIDIDDTFETFINGEDGNYTRRISVEMNRNFQLAEVGQYFDVLATLRDYGNETSAGTMYAVWKMEIINGATLDIYNYSCTHPVVNRVV
ncbi:MAG: hypothetical protein IJB72_02685 [Clostridia bacterium]|nr:hypothetical protein [Clostridia bacterium]